MSVNPPENGKSLFAVVISGQDGALQYYNETAARFWGRYPEINTPAESLFSGAPKVYDSEGVPLPHHHVPMARTIRHNISTRQEEICIEKPDGSRLAVLESTDPIRGLNEIPNGAISLSFLATKDDSDLSEQTMDESYEEAIIENTLDGTITKWSDGATKLFGYSHDEVLGQSIDMLIPPAQKREEQQLRKQLASNAKIEAFETVRMAKGKEQMLVSLRVAGIRNSDGALTGCLRKVRNVTFRVPFRQKLDEYSHHLSLIGKYKDQFLGLAGHELRTPLTSLKGYIELIEAETKEEPLRQYIKKARQQTDVLTSLVHEMLDLSRIENGKLQLNFTSFDINELLEECVKQRQLQHKAFEFENLAITKGPLIVTGDRERLGQVLFHLLHNAVNYSGSEKKVILDVEKGDGELTLMVRDFGVGIPADKHELIFSRFFRVMDRTDFTSGLGIGLYICREIISRHQGDIWVESREGQGAAFFVRIPLIPHTSC